MNSKGKQRKITARKPKGMAEEKCIFCLSSVRDLLRFGKMYKYRDIYVHYYCLLLSSALVQKGKDQDGIFGFLIEDIVKEARRGEKLRCTYCKKHGATIGCSDKKCRTSFHLPCGIQNNALNEFYDKYDSYCNKHRALQQWDENNVKNEDCPTCYNKVDFDEGIQVLATPCCHKLIHRLCLQKQALSAGSHHFKCPLCCNKDKFKKTMMKYGIHVPIQDASWELESNAYGDLYIRHSTCDREPCLCPNGRSHRQPSGDWQLLICETCGSNGSHWKCVRSPNWIDNWVCDECTETLEKKKRLTDDRVDPDESIGNSASDDDIIEIVSDADSSNRFSDSNLSLQSFGISDRSESSRVKRLKTEMRIEKKDKAIQCCLEDAENLIDTNQIDDTTPQELNRAIVAINRFCANSYEEVIDIDDSDDDILILN